MIQGKLIIIQYFLPHLSVMKRHWAILTELNILNIFSLAMKKSAEKKLVKQSHIDWFVSIFAQFFYKTLSEVAWHFSRVSGLLAYILLFQIHQSMW